MEMLRSSDRNKNTQFFETWCIFSGAHCVVVNEEIPVLSEAKDSAGSVEFSDCRKIGDRAFSVAAPRAWNLLPTDLKLLRSTTSFKKKNLILFHAAYSENTD